MLNNLYLYNKMLQQHERELLQEAEQQRMLAELPRRTNLHSHVPSFADTTKKANAMFYDGTHIPMIKNKGRMNQR